MSATLSTIARPAVPSPFSPLFIARYFIHRAAIARLRERDDRALQDIGLTRNEIEAAVRGRLTAPGQARMP
jgi:uncharacterized protein YjiS (DUF1127 family)